MSVRCESVIFDLDGTLIDSSPGILRSYEEAFCRCGVTPLLPWRTGLIGPTLTQTIALQCGSQNPALLQSLRETFITCYDNDGFRLSAPYSGIPELLTTLQRSGIRLFIATNKRILPTRRIVTHLGLDKMFEGVFGVDSLGQAQTPKSDVIRHIVQKYGLAPKRCLYLGDRLEDYEASTAAELPFVLATWGFGDAEALVPKDCPRVNTAESFYRLV